MNKNYTDWNTFNLPLLIQKDPTEVNKLYNTTKPIFLKLLKNNEELFNDLIICILANVHAFDPKKGLFSGWIYTIAINKRNLHHQQLKKNLSPKYDDKTVAGFDYEDWTTEQKIELENRMNLITPDEQMFIEDYLRSKTKKSMQERQRYSRLIKKIKV